MVNVRWGNMSAINVLNDQTNAKATRGQDLDLAFVGKRLHPLSLSAHKLIPR
jgi:hypothetical protein